MHILSLIATMHLRFTLINPDRGLHNSGQSIPVKMCQIKIANYIDYNEFINPYLSE